MTSRNKNLSERDRLIASEAARWHETLPLATDSQRREFSAWLKKSPAHVREFVLSRFVGEALSRFDPQRKLPIVQRDPHAKIIPLHERTLHTPDARPASVTKRSSRRLLSVAAAALLACAVGLTYFVLRSSGQVYETALGEQLTVSLADGSLVALNAKTRLQVSLEPQQRTLRLLAGQAMFTVAHDAKRPFIVYVDDVAVRAVGTKFDVRRAGDKAMVSVVEGRVQIVAPKLLPAAASIAKTNATQLSPGQGITIMQDGAVTAPKPVNVTAVSAWQERRLIFEERSLAEIADEFAAYTRTPRLVIEGPELAARLYTGSFDVDRPDTFIAYLARDPSIEIVRSGDHVIIRPVSPR